MSDKKLPNPFGASQERAGASQERTGAADPQQPVTPAPLDPATAEIVRAIEHELRHPRLLDKFRPFGSSPHLLDQFRKRIENGE
jgi:hypothetical protein